MRNSKSTNTTNLLKCRNQLTPHHCSHNQGDMNLPAWENFYELLLYFLYNNLLRCLITRGRHGEQRQRSIEIQNRRLMYANWSNQTQNKNSCINSTANIPHVKLLYIGRFKQISSNIWGWVCKANGYTFSGSFAPNIKIWESKTLHIWHYWHLSLIRCISL